jgi:hypothetical protein
VSERNGRFLYKVRPGSETSVVFGTLQGDEIEARITDRLIRVGGITVGNSVFNGVGAGVVVGADGSVSIAAPIPGHFFSCSSRSTRTERKVELPAGEAPG